MPKRIRRHQIRAGMFIADLEDSSRQERTRPYNFLIKDEAQALKIKSSNVISIVIDTGKGTDFEGREAQPATADPTASVQLLDFTDEDLKQAIQAVAHTRALLESLFADIRKSGIATYKKADLAVEQIARSMENNPAALIGITRLKS